MIAKWKKEPTVVYIADSVRHIPDELYLDKCFITDVYIGSNVRTIGDSAFEGCSGITNVHFKHSNDGLKSIGYRAFHYCDGLTSFNLPYNNQPMTIGDEAFALCRDLSSFYASNTISIGSRAFEYCEKLEEAGFSSSIRTIGYHAFNSCTSLKRLDLTNIQHEIEVGDYAFDRCNLLSDINWDAIKIIGRYAFDYCYSIENVQLSSEYIGDCAFYGCYGLLTATLWDDVVNVGEKIFNGCKCLVEIKNCSEIDKALIVNPYTLAYITNDIKKGVFDKSNGVLYYSNSKTTPQIPKTAIGILEDTDTIAIDNDCNSIHTLDLYLNPFITQTVKNIILPTSIDSIMDVPFDNCYNLDNVYYCGTAEQWRDLVPDIESYSDNLINAKIFMYSETEPIEQGNFWYYGGENNDTPVIWPPVASENE